MKTDIDAVLNELRNDPRFFSGVTAWHHFPAKEGQFSDIPPDLHPSLVKALSRRGIQKLYTHQREVYDLATRGEDVTVVTPTASGKTYCYNLPVIDSILKDGHSRALYIFPTKALAQDQLAELESLSSDGGFSLKTFTFDGDTPSQKRRLAKETGQVIVTNPDMLHQAILPNHATWVKLFSALKYVVIDEMHGYRGVFGSHVANVIQRLLRIADFYGRRPQFILASATIANPLELAEKLTGRKVCLVDKNGAPSGEKDVIFYNPPVVSSDGATRQSAIDAATRISSRFIKNGIQTIVFARSRVAVELLVQYLRSLYGKTLEKEKIQGYRGGYLPGERREIEKKLRQGEILGVCATNALELGIDIGHLDCAVLAGYPGTIASTWQQAGRAGRRSGKSCAILVASNSPLDQFIIKHPDYFFEQSPEHGLINPDNPYIKGEHVKCAAYELPFKDEPETRPSLGGQDVTPFLENLASQGILHRAYSRWNWSSQSFPAQAISLRSSTNDNFVVVDETSPTPRVIGEVDFASAPLLIHDQAIYMHKGEQYHVRKLDFEARKAYVKKVNVDYYTDASLAVGVRVITVDGDVKDNPMRPRMGELSITTVATIFKKIKLYTHENVGSGEISLPEMNMHTQGMWFNLPEEVEASIDPHDVGGVLSGLANVILNIAPLFLMCDKKDLGTAVEVRSSYDGKPTVYLYDAYPGGVGLSEKAFTLLPAIIKASLELVASCPCAHGCPGCVGPSEEVGEKTKHLCLSVLKLWP